MHTCGEYATKRNDQIALLARLMTLSVADERRYFASRLDRFVAALAKSIRLRNHGRGLATAVDGESGLVIWHQSERDVADAASERSRLQNRTLVIDATTRTRADVLLLVHLAAHAFLLPLQILQLGYGPTVVLGEA